MRDEYRTRIFAVGSHNSSCLLVILMSAPISFRIFMTPIRVGFIPIFKRLISEPGQIAAATIKNAAEDISPGMSILVPIC